MALFCDLLRRLFRFGGFLGKSQFCLGFTSYARRLGPQVLLSTEGRAFGSLLKNKYGSESFGIMSMAPFPSKKTILTKPLLLFVIFHPNNRFLPRLSSFVRFSYVDKTCCESIGQYHN